MTYSDYINTATNIAHAAAEEMNAIYERYKEAGDVEQQSKEDDSPLTKADTVAHDIITRRLAKQFLDIPVISEENTEKADMSESELFWLVDPLDGTKEFLKQNDEFTVNIGLVEGDTPVGGVIVVPALNVTYWADETGAYRRREGETEQMYVSARTERLIAVQSKSHSSEEEEEFFQDYDVADRTGAGSSLKFCRVAEGDADIYYRGGQTMEWDTAAGHAIVEAAGGAVLTTDGERFTYRKEGFANLPFVCTNGKL